MTNVWALSSDDMARVLEFFQIDKDWFDHLLVRDFNCVCRVNDRGNVYCKEYHLVREINSLRSRLQSTEEELQALVSRQEAGNAI